jgi:uncharacterized membrane protein
MEISAALIISGLWALFLATHVGLSSQTLRPTLVEKLGPAAFLGLYSLVALITFVPLAYVYSTHKHEGDFLWYGSSIAWMRPVVYAGMVLAFTLAIGAFLNPSPASIAPGNGQVRGVLRVTRHPLFMGVALFGLLHLCVMRVHVSDLAFFGALPIVSLIGCWHQDLRKLSTATDELRSFYSETSFLPFTKGGIREVVTSPLPLILGVGSTILLRAFHPALFGGSP